MVRSDGSSLSKGDIEGLRKDFSGEVVIKGETDEGKYRTLIDRWNHVHITEAVRLEQATCSDIPLTS